MNRKWLRKWLLQHPHKFDSDDDDDDDEDDEHGDHHHDDAADDNVYDGQKIKVTANGHNKRQSNKPNGTTKPEVYQDPGQRRKNIGKHELQEAQHPVNADRQSRMQRQRTLRGVVRGVVESGRRARQNAEKRRRQRTRGAAAERQDDLEQEQTEDRGGGGVGGGVQLTSDSRDCLFVMAKLPGDTIDPFKKNNVYETIIRKYFAT